MRWLQKSQPHALLRLHDTAAQSGLNRSQRLNNLRNAFMVEPNISPQLKGKRVIVVDDVMTTGATLNAIAATLARCGCRAHHCDGDCSHRKRLSTAPLQRGEPHLPQAPLRHREPAGQ